MLCVGDSIADRLCSATPQAAEWEHIGKWTDAAMMFARLDFVFTRGMHGAYWNGILLFVGGR